MSQHPLTGGEVDVCGDEAAVFGVVVSALQVIEPRFFIIYIAAIAEGLLCAEGHIFIRYGEALLRARHAAACNDMQLQYELLTLCTIHMYRIRRSN